ncbi:MAG: hypothetical protein ACP5N7_02015 [Candidatus Pacearchaeota archaeon]
MNLEQIEFLKKFIKILEKASFDVSTVELLNIATQIQAYSKIVIEMENSLKQIPVDENPVALKTNKGK